MAKSEQDAKNECYLAISKEFYNHLDHGECQELLRKIFSISRDSNADPAVKYFDIRHELETESAKTAQFNINNKDEWQSYLDDQGLSRN